MDIIAQNEFEAVKSQKDSETEKGPILGRSRIFKRKGGIEPSIIEGQEAVSKKMKINMPQAKYTQNKGLLSFGNDEEDDEN